MLQVALLGFGTIGCGVAELLEQNRTRIEQSLNEKIHIKYILDLRDFGVIVRDPEVSVVAEMMGGSHPAYEFTKDCLLAGKSVVTSNKEVVANFGVELLKLAREHKVSYLFEASVGGGIPVIRPFRTDLKADAVSSVYGIVNGTTNYILTQMKEKATEFSVALSEAQQKGYAEKDPTDDIEGLDAARKIVVLAALAFGKMFPASSVYTKGISDVSTQLMALASSMGFSVKLIASAQNRNGRISLSVAPSFVPANNPLANIRDVYNGILVQTEFRGDTVFYGKGAGRYPTAAAVVSDVVEALAHPCQDLPDLETGKEADLEPYESQTATWCLVFQSKEADIPEITSLFPAVKAKYQNNDLVVLITTPISLASIRELASASPAPLLQAIRIID